jgi:hypothetical protein
VQARAHTRTKLKLLTQTGKRHVSLETVEEFENAILRDPGVSPVEPLVRDALQVPGQALEKLRLPLPYAAPLARISDSCFTPLGRTYFLIMMGPTFSSFLPPGRKSIYLFDVWPTTYERVRKYVVGWHIQDVFVSSSQAARALESQLPNCRVSWVPEGIDPTVYDHRPSEAKDIDVLQFGRKHDAYHELIRTPLEASHKSYLYERVKGEIIFPSRAAFVDGLARSRVSVCFPCNLTHPERSGDTETMTQRYLQSMASKCLVIGHAPAEMTALFGYDPVVEADMTDPAGQLIAVLDSIEQYRPLIERNYRKVMEAHTWSVRWRAISDMLLA